MSIKNKIHYNPITGIFKNLENNKVYNSVANTGYIYIWYNNKLCLAHRLAFLYMTGKLPHKVVDHIDRNKTNNKWENLRSVTQAENGRNTNLRKDNSSGVKGVWYSKRDNLWYARCWLKGKAIKLGSYKVKEDAIQARLNGEALYY